VFGNERTYPLNRIESSSFHRFMFTHARRNLGAKLWKCGQMPPERDFVNLCPVDYQSCMSRSATSLIVAVAYTILYGPVAGLVMLSLVGLKCSYDLRLLFFRISMTREGITEVGPKTRRFIAWEGIDAVFCNRLPHGREFVVLSGSDCITVTNPLATDLEVMRKFFYSLPQRTPCVNFDQNWRRAKRRSRKRSSGLALDAPDPIATF